MNPRLALFALVVIMVCGPVTAQPTVAAIAADPVADKAHPASMMAVAIPSHGEALNAVFYAAAGAGPHPTVVLFHGLPGNEQNLDLAQAIRRDGWNVLTLHYRGSWGTPGAFSFTHCLEDGGAALAWLRNPSSPVSARVDTRRIVVIGHSMGGFVAAWVGEQDPAVAATGMISAADMGPVIGGLPRAVAAKAVDDNIGTSAGMHALAGTSPEALADEAIAHADDWDFTRWASALSRRPLLLVTSDDGLAGGSNALAKAARAAGGTGVSEVHIATDHSYSDHRIALEAAVLNWLEGLRP